MQNKYTVIPNDYSKTDAFALRAFAIILLSTMIALFSMSTSASAELIQRDGLLCYQAPPR